MRERLGIASEKIQVVVLPEGARHRKDALRAIEQTDGMRPAEGDWMNALVAVVDLTHPDGMVLLQRAVEKNLRTLAIANLADLEGLQRAQEIGAEDFIGSTALKKELPLRLRQAVARHALARASESAKAAAEQAAATLEDYASYFARLPDGVAVLDRQGNVVSINPAGAQLLEFRSPEGSGGSSSALAVVSDKQALQEVCAASAEDTVRRDFDLVVRRGDGVNVTLSASAAPLGGNRAGAILTFRDVTARRQLAAELKHTKEFLERLINSSVDAIVAADINGKVILFSRGAEEIAGYSGAEALELLNVKDLYPPGVADEILKQMREPQIRARGRLGVGRQEIVTKTGQRVPVNMTASIIYEDDRETATVFIHTDLRDRVQLERKLSDAENRLEETEKTSVIVELAGTAAHELNQPLTSVMGYADLLKRKLKEDDFAYRPVDIIYREAERMAEIVRKIGKITRYETKSYIGSSKILDLDKASSHDE